MHGPNFETGGGSKCGFAECRRPAKFRLTSHVLETLI